jgi:tyrosine-specific transport protein
MRKNIPVLEAVAVIIGTVIGAGVLGIPFVFAQNNFYISSILLVVVALAMTMLMLFLGEITLRTNGKHQITGYTEIYLGKVAREFQAIVLILGVYGSLVAYTIGQGSVFANLFGGSELVWSLVFFACFSLLIVIGLSVIKHVELVLTIALFIILAVIGFLSMQSVNLTNIGGFDTTGLFLTYGVVLFACSGVIAVPHARSVLEGRGREKYLKRSIVAGSLFPPLLYLIFAFLVVGVTGVATTDVATIGLGNAIGPQMIIIGSVFAFFAMSTSFLTMGLALQDIYQYDYRMPKIYASVLVVSIPLIMFLAGVRDFIQVLGFVGAVGLGIGGIITVFVYWKARKTGERVPEYQIPERVGLFVGVFLIALFLAGIVSVFM